MRLTERSQELLLHLVEKGQLTRQRIFQLRMGPELNILKDLELVEAFGDVVIPTVEARTMAKNNHELVKNNRGLTKNNQK